MWHWGTQFSDGLDSIGGMVGLSDPRGFSILNMIKHRSAGQQPHNVKYSLISPSCPEGLTSPFSLELVASTATPSTEQKHLPFPLFLSLF